MATEAELAQLDRNWWLNEADKAAGENGVLDPAAVNQVARRLGWPMTDVYTSLTAALSGRYEGSAEGGRALLSAPGMKRQLARHKGISIGEAAVELSGTGTPEGSVRIADLADELVAREEAEGRDLDYGTALGLVSRPGYSPPQASQPYELAAGNMGRSAYEPAAWVRATIVHLEDRWAEDPDPAKHLLPIRKPDGSLSLEAMRRAEQQLLRMREIPPEKRREAARELLSAYRRLDENPPDSLRGLAGDVGTRELSAGEQESERIADAAEEYAAEHGVDLMTATIEVQRGER